MNGLNAGKYVPTSTIRTEPLTSRYTIQGDIGRGKFAVVRKCVHIESGEVVAAKVIRKRRKGKSCREEILREVVMLEYAMAHPRLVSLREVYETPSELILVTEYCSGGELFHECVIEESFSEKDVVHLMVQILEGLCYLHENNIVHLDLKPQNILLTEPFPKGDIKICDLGFACLTNTGEDIRDIIGTPDYVAPEVLDYEPLSIQTDMWSLGVLAYVMLTACSPFAGDNQQETFCNISQVKLDFPADLFSKISSEATDFIKKLLVKDPRGRMTARQCFEHPWLAAARHQMHISLPALDHTAALAQGMVTPSNWNPDRRNSFGKTPTSPTLAARANKSPGSPYTARGNRRGSSSTQPGISLGIEEEGDSLKADKSSGERSAQVSLSSHSDDLLTKTIEEIGIDTTKFKVSERDNKDASPASKRQSVEIPVKKAKCSSDAADGDTEKQDQD
ncbi:hypothetical protein BaRGS_00020489 [Batillaria attramentaria]|uniref:non-specific serine/threonine protein kinase n=1 Tax=Batillaria attramentaria TaxID=370345 RepID=A0ABD0KMU3_9CAEN